MERRDRNFNIQNDQEVRSETRSVSTRTGRQGDSRVRSRTEQWSRPESSTNIQNRQETRGDARTESRTVQDGRETRTETRTDSDGSICTRTCIRNARSTQ